MESNKQRDLRIIESVLAGNIHDYEDILTRYRNKICSVCYPVVHIYEDAMDLSQEVFLKAFKNLKKFSGRSAFYTWLYTIAMNASKDFRRKKVRLKKVEPYEGQVLNDEGKSSYGPREMLGNKEAGKIITEAIDELPEEQKQVIILREISGLSYNEIAEQLKCSEGTVMSRLHYARKKLQEKLRSYKEVFDEKQ